MEEEKERDRDTDGETSYPDALIGEEEQTTTWKKKKKGIEIQMVKPLTLMLS